MNFLHAYDVTIDHSTNLMWQNNEDVQNITKNWDDAKQYCEQMTLDKYDDWRLPTIYELQSVINVENKKPAINNEHLFTALGFYWSNTERVNDPYNAWGVHFSYGYVEYGSTSGANYIRCVR